MYGLGHLGDAVWAMPFGRRDIWAMPFGRRATWATGHLGDAVWATAYLGDRPLGRCRLGDGLVGRQATWAMPFGQPECLDITELFIKTFKFIKWIYSQVQFDKKSSLTLTFTMMQFLSKN